MTAERIKALEDALTLAANRLHRVALDFDTGSFMKVLGWADEACTALADSQTASKREADPLLGGIIGVAEIVDCVSASESRWFQGPYGFVLTNARPVDFIPVKGRLMFFDWRKAMRTK